MMTTTTIKYSTGLAVWAGLHIIFQILLFLAFVYNNIYALNIMQVSISFGFFITVINLIPAVKRWKNSPPKVEIISEFKSPRVWDIIFSIGYALIIIVHKQYLLAGIYLLTKIFNHNKA